VREADRDTPWGDGPVRVRAPAAGALPIEDGAARVLAAATPLRPDDAWTPCVGFAGAGRTVHLQPIDGPAITCSLLDTP
jgi:hypothetical protein